ncbi:MAG: hypothetical protein ACKPKO_51780, partial [Candidatus Fonsibacter sp.]
PRPPQHTLDEVILDYQLSAILDIAVGDGSLALIAARDRFTYTGFVVTDEHRDMVMASLFDRLCARALQVGDKWYDPNLVKTLANASKNKKQRARAHHNQNKSKDHLEYKRGRRR